MVSLSENAATLNIVLHTFYDMPFAQFSPTLDELIRAVDALALFLFLKLVDMLISRVSTRLRIPPGPTDRDLDRSRTRSS